MKMKRGIPLKEIQRMLKDENPPPPIISQYRENGVTVTVYATRYAEGAGNSNKCKPKQKK